MIKPSITLTYLGGCQNHLSQNSSNRIQYHQVGSGTLTLGVTTCRIWIGYQRYPYLYPDKL